MEAREQRGYAWAGLEWIVEVPAGVDPERDWNLPIGFVPCAHPDPDRAVRIEVSNASAAAPLPGGTAYFHEGDVFEAGRLGGHHWIRRAEDGRVAVAAPDFGAIEVALPMPATRAGFPLAHPLDDIILLHRALEQGAFALRGAAAVRDGEAIVLLGDAPRADVEGRTALWQGWLVLQPAGDGVDVLPLPSTIRSGRSGWAGTRARLAGLHVTTVMTGASETLRVLDADAAAGELLRFAFAPIDGGESGEKLLWAATASPS